MRPRKVTLDSCVNYARRCLRTNLSSSCCSSAEHRRDTSGNGSDPRCAYSHESKTWSGTFHLRRLTVDEDWALPGVKSSRRSKVLPSVCVNGAAITSGWHCSGRTATSDVCTSSEVWRDHTWDGAATAALLKGFIMASARSIHIGSENIYPLWNGWSHNGPVVFKESHSENCHFLSE